MPGSCKPVNAAIAPNTNFSIGAIHTLILVAHLTISGPVLVVLHGIGLKQSGATISVSSDRSNLILTGTTLSYAITSTT